MPIYTLTVQIIVEVESDSPDSAQDDALEQLSAVLSEMTTLSVDDVMIVKDVTEIIHQLDQGYVVQQNDPVEEYEGEE